jgi:hypothetical protein
MLYDQYNKFTGEALIETSNVDVAFKVAKRNKECKGSRSILIQVYDG